MYVDIHKDNCLTKARVLVGSATRSDGLTEADPLGYEIGWTAVASALASP